MIRADLIVEQFDCVFNELTGEFQDEEEALGTEIAISRFCTRADVFFAQNSGHVDARTHNGLAKILISAAFSLAGAVIMSGSLDDE